MLKSESLELKQQAAQHRMEVADLKREISRYVILHVGKYRINNTFENTCKNI